MTSSSSTRYTSKLHNKSILVLGSTSGIGYAVAEACLESRCARLVISGSQQPKIDKTIERLRATYPQDAFPTKLTGLACDLADLDKLESNLVTLLSFATEFGSVKLDHVVNTAGDPFSTPPLSQLTIDAVAKAGSVRFYGSLMLAKLLSPNTNPEVTYMNSSATSSIVLTGGAIATKPLPNWATSVGWTAAKEGLTRGLAVDLAPIRVNCVAPGVVLTEFLSSFSGGDDTKLEEMLNMFKSRSLTNTVGMPEDLAEAYLWLMRDNYVTGQVVHSNGGYFLA